MISFMLRRYYPCLSSLNGPNSRAGGGGEKHFSTSQELSGISEVFQSVVTTLAELQALRLSILSHYIVQKCCYSWSTLNTASQWCTASQDRDTHGPHWIQHHNGALRLKTVTLMVHTEYSITMVHCVSSPWHSWSTLNTASQWCTASQDRDTIDFDTETSEDKQRKV
jgi:hypothetical protein